MHELNIGATLRGVFCRELCGKRQEMGGVTPHHQKKAIRHGLRMETCLAISTGYVGW